MKLERKHKAYLRINLVSLFFVAVSFISVTLAWFAYSGISHVETEIGVKAWYIEFEKNSRQVSNDIVISLDDIYPGMNTVSETVNIKNMGDSDAQIKYGITSARVLNQEYDPDTSSSESIEDTLSHTYPFSINISLSKKYVSAHDESGSIFQVTVSWPLDSGHDGTDSDWGKDAYDFQTHEDDLHNADNSYTQRSSLKLTISVNAEQYIQQDNKRNIQYNLGDLVYYDIVNPGKCDNTNPGPDCVKTHVLANDLNSDYLLLLPDLYDTSYSQGAFSSYVSLINEYKTRLSSVIETEDLYAEDIMKLISTDVEHSVYVRPNMSNSIIGYLNYGTSVNNLITSNTDGYFTANNLRFPYLASERCYWLKNKSGSSNSYAITKNDDNTIKVYLESQPNCSAVPALKIPKSNM